MASEKRTTDEGRRPQPENPTSFISFSLPIISDVVCSGGGLFGSSPAGGAQPAATQYKVVVVGDGATGKTAWLAKLLGNDFPTTYRPTIGVAVRSVDEESLRFSMSDCAGQEQFGGLRDGHYIGGQAAVIFFDLGSHDTFANVANWYEAIVRVCGNVPIVVVGAKCDLAERMVAPETVAQFVEAHGLEYVEVSAKEDTNTRKPLELLTARLTNATSAEAEERTTTSQSGGSLGSAPTTEWSWPSVANTSPSTSSGGSSLFDSPAAAADGGGSGAQPAAVTQYKVVVAGDGGTGKTAWLAKLLGNDFPATYNPTLGVAVQYIDEESLRFSMWDCAGQERFGGLRDAYFIGGQAAVIFFDLGSRVSLSQASRWYRDIVRVCGDIPTIVVGAKCDLAVRVVASGTVPQFVESHGLEYVELSAKQDINTRKPLELLAAKLINAKSAATPQSGGSLFGLSPATAPASPGFSWPSEPKREPEVGAGSGLFGRGDLTPPTSGGGGGLFGTSPTGGHFPAPTSGGGGGLFGTSTTGGGFTAPTSGGGGGLFGTSTTGGSQLGGTPVSGLFGNSGGGGGFSNTSAPTPTGGGGLFTGGSFFGSSPDDGSGAQPEAVTQYKVVVVGDGGTGKTAWLAKLLGNDFPTTYNPTLGVAVRSIDEESIRFSMWDCAGQEQFSGLRDGYFIGAQAAVIFFDLSSRFTFSQASRWYRDVARVCGDIPTIVVGGKCDLTERVVPAETVPQFVERYGLEYVELSAKEDINTRRPLELLAAKLTKK